jgi:predicted Zn-dependent protease
MRRLLLTAPLALLALNGCATLGSVAEAYGNATGDKTLAGAGTSLKRSAETSDFTEDEKVYTGRSVAANLLASEPLSERARAQRYVNTVGQVLAQASGKAALPQGWHFILLKDPQVGAFSVPGGIVLVDEGLVDLCQDEDELAGVLAHEISHVALDHPMQAVSAANRSAALMGLANVAYSKASQGNGQLAGLGDQFNSVLGQVGEAVDHGYDRDKEAAADLEAVRILSEVGYDPHGLARVLRRLKAGDRSHGDPQARAAAVEQAAQGLAGDPAQVAVRKARFLASR